jgi:hypothetical protein
MDHQRHLPRLTLTSWAVLPLVALACWCTTPAWAYKVEKVCTEKPATAAEPAKKTCKIVRVDPNKEGAAKEEKKEEKKKSGH